MGVLEKYSEKEVLAAVCAVDALLAGKNIGLQVEVNGAGQVMLALHASKEHGIGNKEEGDGLARSGKLELMEKSGASLVLDPGRKFSCLGMVVDCLDKEILEPLREDYLVRVAAGDFIETNDFARKALIFLESEYCQDLIWAIDGKDYRDMKEKYWSKDGLLLPAAAGLFSAGAFAGGEYLTYFGYDSIGRLQMDGLGYLDDKSIALKIAKEQSAFAVIEHDGVVYDVQGDYLASDEQFIRDLEAGKDAEYDYFEYGDYREYIEGQMELLKEDVRDFGLYGDGGRWSFYLTEKELEYVGMRYLVRLERTGRPMEAEPVGEALHQCTRDFGRNSDARMASLIRMGVDVNYRYRPEEFDFRPIHMAAYGGQLNKVKMLVAAGCDVNAVAENGETALDMAIRRHNQKDVVGYLRECGAKTADELSMQKMIEDAELRAGEASKGTKDGCGLEM